MRRTRCTARVEHGRTKTRAHNVTADCTRVRIYNETGDLLVTRWVCATCRQRMRLPDTDLDIRPGVTNVSDEIHDPDLDQQLEHAQAVELATGGVVMAGRDVVVGEGGFRLP